MRRRFQISKALVLSITCLGIFTAFFSTPVFAEDIYKTTNEDAAVEISQKDLVKASGLSAALYYATVSDPVNGVIVVASDNRSIMYNPEPNYNGSDSFVVRVTTGGDNAQYTAVRVNVAVYAVNDAPVFVTTTLLPESVNESTSYSARLVAEDVDPGDTIGISGSGLPEWLTLTDNGDKTASLIGMAPPVFADTTYAFYVILQDSSNSETVSRQFNVTVKNVNQSPVADAGEAQTAVIKGGDTATVQLDGASSYDPDGTIVSWVWTEEKIQIATGAQPTADLAEGDHLITLTVTDNGELWDTDTVEITVKKMVNAAPIANAGDDQQIKERDAVTLDGNKSYDPDGDPITYAWTGPPGITLSGPNLPTPSFTAPEVGEDTTVTFILTVADPNGATGSDRVDVTIQNINHTPVAEDSQIVTDEDTQVTVNLSASDPDGDTLTYGIVVWPMHGSLIPQSNGGWVYNPHQNFYGEDSFVWAVSDPAGKTAQATVAIQVNSVNDLPVFVTDALFPDSVDEGDEFTANIEASDVDGERVGFSAADLPEWLGLTDNGNDTATLFGIAPPVDKDVNFSIEIALSDSSGDSSVRRQFTVRVRNRDVNQSPVANAGEDQTIQLGADETAAIVTLNGSNSSDPDGSIVSWDWYLGGTKISSGSKAAVSLTQGAYAITLIVTDNDGATAQDEIVVTVLGYGNQNPKAYAAEINGVEDVAVSQVLVAYDPDGDVLIFSLIRQPVHGLVQIDNPAVTGTRVTYWPEANWNGVDGFAYAVDDGNGGTASAEVTVKIDPVNDAPEFSSTPETAAVEQSVYTYNVSASDIDNDTLTMTAPTLPAWLALTDNGNGTATLSGAPTADGTFTVVLSVSDGQAEDTQAFNIEVAALPTSEPDPPVDPDPLPVNHAPTVKTIETLTATEGATFQYQVVASDADEDPLEYSLFNNSSWLTISAVGVIGVSPEGGTLPYDASGVYSLRVTVSDGSDSTAEDFILVVNNTNRAPVISSYSPEGDQTLSVGDQLAFTVAAYDPDGDTLNYFWSATVGKMTTSTSSAQAVYTATTAGDVAVRLVITDQFGDSASLSWDVQVSAVPTDSGTPDTPDPGDTTTPSTPETPAAPDTEAPLITATVIGIEGDNDYYRSVVKLVVEASDNVKVTKIVYSKDSADAVEVADDYVLITASIDGSHSYSIYAVDSSGNVSETITPSFMIDQTKPVIDDITIRVGAAEYTDTDNDDSIDLGATPSSNPVIYAAVTDAGSGVSGSDLSITFNNGAELSVTATQSNSSGTTSSGTTGTSAGAYDISYTTLGSSQINTGTTVVKISAQDLAGNEVEETFNIVTEALAEGYAYPNPADPSLGQPITFAVGLSAATQIQISVYDENARMIKSIVYDGQEGNNTITWNGVNEFGSLIGNGLYPYRVIDLASRQVLAKGKLVVIRSR